MNFLELINKCLLELNYKQVNSFSELVKNDHKRIMNILNTLNREICNAENWEFLLRRTLLELKSNTTEIENSVNGKILCLYIDGKKYEYLNDFEQFINKNFEGCRYSAFNDKLLFPIFKEDKKVEVVYYTNNSVLAPNTGEKMSLEKADDESLIPMPFAEQLLVYGTCLRLKANPQYFKFSYWLSLYKEALANLRARTTVSATENPLIKLYRY